MVIVEAFDEQFIITDLDVFGCTESSAGPRDSHELCLQVVLINDLRSPLELPVANHLTNFF